MKIQLTINDKDCVIESDPAEMLADVLRMVNFNLVKHGCLSTSCGACYVLVDDKAVPSCHIPVGIVMGAKITTLEYFSKSEAYADIMKGFEKAGISLCGYCNAGKIFLAYEILSSMTEPTREKISAITSRINDCCVEQNALINGILYAYSIHFNKEKLR